MHDCKPIDTLIAQNKGLSHNMCSKTLDVKEKTACVPYADVVESLMYAMMCT